MYAFPIYNAYPTLSISSILRGTLLCQQAIELLLFGKNNQLSQQAYIAINGTTHFIHY